MTGWEAEGRFLLAGERDVSIMHEEGFWEVAHLRTVAGQCGYSSGKFAASWECVRATCAAKIRLRFGVSMGDWIKEQRLLAAADELRVIRVVKLVAFAFGFPSVSQFSREFRHWFLHHTQRVPKGRLLTCTAGDVMPSSKSPPLITHLCGRSILLGFKRERQHARKEKFE